MSDRKSHEARKVIQELSAYHVDATHAQVVLDANESPYPPTRALREKFFFMITGTDLNRYPDMNADSLRIHAAKKEGIAKDEILFGNGSDDLIQLILAAYIDPGETILAPSPTFVMYSHNARFFSAEVVESPLADDFSFDGDALLKAVAENKPRVTFLARPNNPTGGILDESFLSRLAEATPGLLVIDEAYIDYCTEDSALPLFREYPNVVILRTLSKVGFAALRLGYVVGDSSVIKELNKARQPFNVNALTQACGVEVFKNWHMLTPYFDEIKGERARVAKNLSGLDEVTVFPSQANFILFKLSTDPKKVFERLLKKGVRVRWFEKAPRLENCFRVTIGKPEENELFIEALRDSLA